MTVTVSKEIERHRAYQTEGWEVDSEKRDLVDFSPKDRNLWSGRETKVVIAGKQLEGGLEKEEILWCEGDPKSEPVELRYFMSKHGLYA